MNEVITKRKFETDIKTIYRAWTEPEHLKNWWGPNGFTNTFLEFDLRPAGKWRLVMHGPDGNHYNSEIVFEEIIPGQMLAFSYTINHKIRVETTFEETANSSTDVCFKMIFYNEDEFVTLENFMTEKNEENFDRLEMELHKMKEQYAKG